MKQLNYTIRSSGVASLIDYLTVTEDELKGMNGKKRIVQKKEHDLYEK